MRQLLLLSTLFASLLLTGCGGARDKGKHQDYDRPKPTEKK